MKALLTSALILGLWMGGIAQTQLLQTPDASPAATVSQTVGLTHIRIKYHRPAVKGRTIWGDLVPYGAVWRAGANDNTVIELSTDVLVEGQPLAAGTYGLHLIPGEEESTLIFSNNSTAWGSFSYNPKEDALRVTIPTLPNSPPVEHLTYAFDNLGENQADCLLQWGDQQFPFHFEVNPEATVMVSIRQQLQNKAGWTWQGWHEAAAFCLSNDLNHQEALGWAGRSVFMQPNPQNMITKAKLTAKVKGNGDPEKEMEYAMASLEEDLEKLPVTWREWHGAANFALNSGRHDEALGWINQSVRMSPNMTNMMTKAQTLTAMGHTDEAMETKAEAIARGSNNELNNYGYQLLFSGRTAEAVEVFEANADKHPEDPNVWDSLGEGYFNHGEKEKAVKAFKKSLSMNPPGNVRANSMKHLQKLGVAEKDLR